MGSVCAVWIVDCAKSLCKPFSFLADHTARWSSIYNARHGKMEIPHKEAMTLYRCTCRTKLGVKNFRSERLCRELRVVSLRQRNDNAGRHESSSCWRAAENFRPSRLSP